MENDTILQHLNLEAIVYLDSPSNREEAYMDTNEKQYNYLKQRVLKKLRYYLN